MHGKSSNNLNYTASNTIDKCTSETALSEKQCMDVATTENKTFSGWGANHEWPMGCFLYNTNQSHNPTAIAYNPSSSSGFEQGFKQITSGSKQDFKQITSDYYGPKATVLCKTPTTTAADVTTRHAHSF